MGLRSYDYQMVRPVLHADRNILTVMSRFCRLTAAANAKGATRASRMAEEYMATGIKVFFQVDEKDRWGGKDCEKIVRGGLSCPLLLIYGTRGCEDQDSPSSSPSSRSGRGRNQDPSTLSHLA